MCGICGYIGLNDENLLDRMLNRIVHRGPDDQGKYTEPGVGIGMRRLSIIDIAGGRQPVTNEDMNIWVVFNGEIYNYRELRDELISKGHRFTSNSDTEVIVHLYEEKGEEMLSLLRGMFSIALWDRKKNTFFLVRDPLGIKPLYYAEKDDGALVFASELGAIRETVSGYSISPQPIAQYLTLLYIPSPDTIFKEIKQLMPGHILKYQGGTKTIKSYFSLPSMVKPCSSLALEQLKEEFRENLKNTVKSHLVSDVPLGLLLSGGLDSSSILSMMRKITSGPIYTFSIGYKDEIDKGFNETSIARSLAERFDTHHIEELLSPDIRDLLPKVVGSMGEPFADSSAIVTYLVSEVARRSVTVALSGTGGDELFGGYPRHLGMLLGSYYQRIPLPLRKFLAQKIAPLLSDKGTHRDQSARIRRFIENGNLPLSKQYINWITFLPHEWKASIFSDEFLKEVNLHSPLERLEGIFNNFPSEYPADKAMGLDIQTYLHDDLLKMGDRMSMAHSLELRVPFCDIKLLSFALQISCKTKLRGMKLKGFMREALKPLLPEEIIDGPKRGFMVPLARWLRENLHDMVHDLLSETRIRRRGYMNPSYVAWLIREHEAGRRNFADQIYALLFLEIWLERQK